MSRLKRDNLWQSITELILSYKTAMMWNYQDGSETQGFPGSDVTDVVVEKQLLKRNGHKQVNTVNLATIIGNEMTLRESIVCISREYRSPRINVCDIQRDLHGVHRRLQKHRELVGPGWPREVRVHGLEAYDLLKAVF